MSVKQELPRAVPLPLGLDGTIPGDLDREGSAARRLLRLSTAKPSARDHRAARLTTACFTPTSSRAAERLPAILAGEGVFVTTGQQPGLFLGPLYVLYKVLSAVAEATRLERAEGVPALASFWIASDDHDWNEVGQARIVTRTGELESMRLQPEPAVARRSVGPAPLGEDVLPLLERFRRAAGPPDATEQTVDPILRFYRPGIPVGEAFRAALAALLADVDLVLFDPTHDDSKRSAIPFIERCLTDAAGVSGAFLAGSRAVTDAGYDAVLQPPERGSQVFFDDGTARRHLLMDGDGLRAGATGPLLSVGEWSERLRAEPHRFSAAAALRPGLESWLLPVNRTVLGPGELSYWAQLGPLFDHLDVRMPVTVPRSSWMLVEPRVERWLDGLGLDASDLAGGTEDLERRLASEARPEVLDRPIRRLREELERELAALEEVAETELKGLSGAFGKARSAIAKAIDTLDGTIDARVRESRETDISRVRRAAALLYPGGVRQERVDSPFGFLSRYGPRFLDLLKSMHGLVP